MSGGGEYIPIETDASARGIPATGSSNDSSAREDGHTCQGWRLRHLNRILDLEASNEEES